MEKRNSIFDINEDGKVTKEEREIVTEVLHDMMDEGAKKYEEKKKEDK